ncbi:hypothetical protein TWF730_007237 [Orbilia blumenaviensis]|uniref:Uncharacterized protein n=1 Tax=Orbilia blumenaviensis TaxID=1796055 RepID=A0AAV9VDM0_9PEZI
MSFSEDLPTVSTTIQPRSSVVDLSETREWKQKLRHSANRLSTDLFKLKHQQYYDRRPSSIDAGTWYSAGSSISGGSVAGGGAASSNYNYSSGGGGGGAAGGGRRTSGVGLIGTPSASGSVSISGEDIDDDRGEVRYSSARMSLIAGAPSPACGGGFGYDEYSSNNNGHSDVHYGFQQSLFEKLYGYGSNGDVDPMGLDASSQPPTSEEILMASKLPRNTSIFRSFEGWGFDAEDVYQMDPTEDVPATTAATAATTAATTGGFKFDSSIRKAAYSENEANSSAVTGVDPLDLMDTSSSSAAADSHPLPIPARLNNNPNSNNHNRKRSSQIALRDYQRRRRGSSLHSAHGNSRQHSRQYSRSASGSISEEGFTSSPYRPSIVLTEMPIFDFSESEPNTRNVSVTAGGNNSRNGSIYGGRHGLPRGSIGNAGVDGSRRSSKVSKKSTSSTAAVSGSPEEPSKKKSFFRFLSGKRSGKSRLPPPTSQARLPDTSFVPLLHDITEVSSISSREATPEIMTATETPLLKVERAANGKPRMLPIVGRPEHMHAMRRASVSLKVEDDDVFDNPAPVMPHRERRSSSVYSQHDLIPLKARQASSIYDGEPGNMRRPSSIYDFDSAEPGLRVRRTSSVYDIESMVQPGEEPSPPSTPWRRYSENYLSNPEVYVPPRANWYKSDWGLDDEKQTSSDARSISSHATGAVKAVLSRQPGSRRGSMDYSTYTPDTSGNGMNTNMGGGGCSFSMPRKRSTDEKMTDLSIALRNALKMNDILEEDDTIQFYHF